MNRTKVYYNSACPVCNAGINGQRRRMRACGIANIEWIDVHRDPRAVEDLGTSLEQVRERLHVRGADGRLAIGAEALAALFVQTPRQRWLGHVMRLPLLRSVARLGYNVFARWLYRWNRANRRW